MKVATWPAVSGLVSGPEVAAAALEPDATWSDVLAPDTKGEELVDRTVVGPLSDEAGATDVSIVRLPSGNVLVAVATEPTGVTRVVADAEFGTSVLLLSTGTIGADDVVVVLLSCRLASATILLAIDASSLCRASAAVLSFSNMPWVNFLGEKSCRAACSDGGSTWSSKRSKASRSDCASCASKCPGVCAMADDVTRVKRRAAGRALRGDIIVVKQRSEKWSERKKLPSRDTA